MPAPQRPPCCSPPTAARSITARWRTARPSPATRRLLDAIGQRPLLDMDMRLGEASGAALAVPILKAAAACHNGMATFAEAGVSGKA